MFVRRTAAQEFDVMSGVFGLPRPTFGDVLVRISSKESKYDSHNCLTVRETLQILPELSTICPAGSFVRAVAAIFLALSWQDIS